MRFFGEVGYGNSEESPTGSGVWIDTIVEYSYYGDVVRKSRRLDQGENLNSNTSVGNSISIVADQYANENFSKIKYIRWSGQFWTIDDVEVQSPRLILRLGDIYNGPTGGD